jgi:hypothetical protein
MTWPVLGFLNTLADRFKTVKLPKPTIFTSLLERKALVMESKMASTASPALDRDIPVASATAAMRSLFVKDPIAMSAIHPTFRTQEHKLLVDCVLRVQPALTGFAGLGTTGAGLLTPL